MKHPGDRATGMWSEQMPAVLAGITGALVAGPEPASTVLEMITAASSQLLGFDAVGIMLADPRGGTEVVFASDEGAAFIELLQSQTAEGPCVDCIRIGRTISIVDLTGERRWPVFVPAALQSGYRAVHTIPMRLDGRTIGGVNLFHRAPRRLTASEECLGQVLADLAVLALAQETDPQIRTQRLTQETLLALNDRVTLGQAIGVVAGSLDIDADKARDVLERYVQRTGRSLREAANDITAGTLRPAELIGAHWD
jgi:GAF domain-containing protein